MVLLLLALLAHAAEAPVWVDTADGAQVTLQRHPTPGGPPVVLVHGISSNHHFWDLEPGRSLARYLQEQGFDVWNMDLRGHGFAVRDEDGKRQRAGWTVDDYGLHDLPAAFSHVREQTGAEEIGFVGHSMGGIVLAVYLAAHAQPPLSAAVVVGSPLDFRDPDLLTGTLLKGGALFGWLPFLPSPFGARLLAGLGTKVPFGYEGVLYNPDNVAPEVAERMLRRVVSPLSRGEVRQFAAARHDGELRSVDGATVYRHALSEVDVPMLFLAGRADRIANTDRVFSYYRAVGSTEKAFVVASTANGFAHDYGHLDYGCGDHAEEEVYPRVADWLRR